MTIEQTAGEELAEVLSEVAPCRKISVSRVERLHCLVVSLQELIGAEGVGMDVWSLDWDEDEATIEDAEIIENHLADALENAKKRLPGCTDLCEETVETALEKAYRIIHG